MALSDEQRAFLARVRAFIPLAEAAGVSGAVMVAQAAIESGWGRSGLARHGNALFGVKARPGWSGRVYSGTTREWAPGRGYLTIPGTNQTYEGYEQAVAAGCAAEALFRAYESIETNVSDYLEFFHRNPRFRPALGAYERFRDPRRFAAGIARAGYATSPTYAHVLVAFMERYLPDLLPAPVTVHWNGTVITGDDVRLDDGRVFIRLRRLAGLAGMTVRYDPDRKTVCVEEVIS